MVADGRHLLTDVVLAGVAIAEFTGWHTFDPAIAVKGALNILWIRG